MLLASDFSGLAWVFVAVVVGVVAFCLIAGAITAGLIRLIAKRGRFRVLMPVCTIAWGPLLWVGSLLYDEWRQVPVAAERPIVARVKSLGGTVDLNDQHHVTGVRLGSPRVADDDLRVLTELPELVFLDLSKSSVTDPGLTHISRIGRLTSLRLLQTQISDAGLQHLKTLTSLAVLDLRGTQVTDDGLEHLHDLVSLGNLWLQDTKVTDDGRVSLLIRLPKLHMLDLLGSSHTSMGSELRLRGAKLTQSGLRLLPELKDLVYLDLAETPITDEDLELLSDLKLVSLDLRQTKVSDAGLHHLESITTLEYLHLVDTQVSPEGIAQFGEKLPRCAFPR